MRRRRLALLATLPALVWAALPAPSSGAAEARGTYVVLLHAATPDAGIARAEALGAEVVAVYRYAVHGYAAKLTAADVETLRADPSVASVEPDAPMYLAGTQTSPPWGLDRIDQHALPLSASYTYGATGTGVTAYVIDTGIRFSHTEFGGRAVSGIDVIDGGTADDCQGHGTHVAGTIGGTTYGVAKNVRLVAVRVFDCTGTSSLVSVMEGVDWVTQDHLANPGPAVANMSIQSGVPQPQIDLAVTASIATGVSYSVAAGNHGLIAGACKSSPGRVSQAMTVGSTDINDRASSFSNYGPCVDWYAPGGSILSAYWTSDTATITMSGTSMATPHNTGVAAQYLELNPAATPDQVHAALGSRVTPNVVTTPEETLVNNPKVNPINDDLLFTDL